MVPRFFQITTDTVYLYNPQKSHKSYSSFQIHHDDSHPFQITNMMKTAGSMTFVACTM